MACHFSPGFHDKRIACCPLQVTDSRNIPARLVSCRNVSCSHGQSYSRLVTVFMPVYEHPFGQMFTKNIVWLFSKGEVVYLTVCLSCSWLGSLREHVSRQLLHDCALY